MDEDEFDSNENQTNDKYLDLDIEDSNEIEEGLNENDEELG